MGYFVPGAKACPRASMFKLYRYLWLTKNFCTSKSFGFNWRMLKGRSWSCDITSLISCTSLQWFDLEFWPELEYRCCWIAALGLCSPSSNDVLSSQPFKSFIRPIQNVIMEFYVDESNTFRASKEICRLFFSWVSLERLDSRKCRDPRS